MFKIEKRKQKYIVYVFGKRIATYKKKNTFERVCQIESFFKANLDITKIPPAKGVLRDLQLATLKILKEIDAFCKQNNITYWLDFGALLGAVRHQGFIPWDDDIDISMPRQDYEKFIKTFNGAKNNLFLTKACNKLGSSVVLKVCSKDIPNIFIDIFPCDFCYQEMDEQQKRDFSDNLKSLILRHKKNIKKHKKLSKEEYFDSFIKLRDDNISHLAKVSDIKPKIFFGIEFYHEIHDITVFDYDIIFPLKTISFEGSLFPSVNQPDLYLTYLYKDYMTLPSKINTHNDLSQIKLEDMIKLKKFLGETKNA